MTTIVSSKADDVEEARARLEAIARTHRRALESYAVMLSGSVADAEDLVQHTFERLCAMPLGMLPPERERAWLCTVLRRLFVDEHRRRRRAGPAVDVTDAMLVAPPDDAAELDWHDLDDADIREALALLDEPFARAFCLHAEGRSYAEIARELAIPMKTVGTRLLRARRKLRVALEARVRRRAFVARMLAGGAS